MRRFCLDAMSWARAVTARRSGASVSSSDVAAAAHVVAVSGATACTAAAAAGDLGLGLRPRNRLDVVMIMIVSTVASWHVDPLGRLDLTFLTLDPYHVRCGESARK